MYSSSDSARGRNAQGAGYGQASDLAELAPKHERVEVCKLDMFSRIRRAVILLRTARSLPGTDLLRLWSNVEPELEQLEKDWGRTVDDYTAQRIRRTLDARSTLRRQP